MKAVLLRIKEWLEWQNALKYAKAISPGLAYLAQQNKNPVLQEVYRRKIIEAYHLGTGK